MQNRFSILAIPSGQASAVSGATISAKGTIIGDFLRGDILFRVQFSVRAIHSNVIQTGNIQYKTKKDFNLRFHRIGIRENFLHSKQEMMTFPSLTLILALIPGLSRL